MNYRVGLLLVCAFATFSDRFLLNRAFGRKLSDISPNKHRGSSNGCDIFHDSWIKDDTYPLYQSSSCPYIRQGFDCQRNGRPDTDYLKYKWKPMDCDLPKGFAEQQHVAIALMYASHCGARGNPVASPGFVYVSSACLWSIDFAIKESVSGRSDSRESRKKLESITTGNQWKGIDMLIFNSYHWWNHRGRFQSWDYIQVGNETIKDMDRVECINAGLLFFI